MQIKGFRFYIGKNYEAVSDLLKGFEKTGFKIYNRVCSNTIVEFYYINVCLKKNEITLYSNKDGSLNNLKAWNVNDFPTFNVNMHNFIKVDTLQHSIEKESDGSFKVGCQRISAADMKKIVDWYEKNR